MRDEIQKLNDLLDTQARYNAHIQHKSLIVCLWRTIKHHTSNQNLSRKIRYQREEVRRAADKQTELHIKAISQKGHDAIKNPAYDLIDELSKASHLTSVSGNIGGNLITLNEKMIECGDYAAHTAQINNVCYTAMARAAQHVVCDVRITSAHSQNAVRVVSDGARAVVTSNNWEIAKAG